jgi:hypothetical protein
LPGKGPPIINSLLVPAAHLLLEDERRHLAFDGVLSAGAHDAVESHNPVESHDAAKAPDADAVSPLRISGKGRLNGHEATLTLDGDPLATAARDKPYHFTLDERSSGSHLTGHGSLPQPFDFRVLDAAVEANGEDLRDLYFLAGVRLPDSGAYHVSGKITRRGTITELSDLVATFGESDVHVALKSKLDDSGRSHIDIDLNSQRLRLADLGARAAGRAPEPPPGEKPVLLPDTPLKLEGIRKSDYAVSFHAQHLDAGKLSFHTVVGKMTIDHGVITVPHLAGMLIPLTAAAAPTSAAAAPGKSNALAPTSAVPPDSPSKNEPEGKITASSTPASAAAAPGKSNALAPTSAVSPDSTSKDEHEGKITASSTPASAAATPSKSAAPTPTSAVPPAGPSKDEPEGKITARIKFDAKTDTPTANLDLRVANIRIAQFMRKDPSQPPLDGLLQGHLDLTGRGRSIHDLASKADGTVTVLLPEGAIRASLAELTGLDFRGLGLMLAKNKEDTPIRCGVAAFKAHDGTLTAQTLLIDTDPVLITGSGTIQLDSEALDLELQGHPKHLRVLRLSAPFSVQGTLAHPSIGLEKGHRKLELIDPGHAKDADCGTLLAQAKTGEMLAEGDSAPAERASTK